MADFTMKGDNKDLLRKLRGAIKEYDKTSKASDKTGKDATKDFKKAGAGVSELTGKVSFLKDALIAVGAVATFKAMISGIRAARKALQSMIAIGSEQEKLNKRLEFSLLRTGLAWSVVGKRISKALTDIQLKTGIGDEDQIIALNALVLGLKDEALALELLQPTLGIAVATGKSFEQVAIAVMKAVNGEADGLKRFGIIVDKAKFKLDALQAVKEELMPFSIQAEMNFETFEEQIKGFEGLVGDAIQGVIIPAMEEATSFFQLVTPEEKKEFLSVAEEFGEKLRKPFRDILSMIEGAFKQIGEVDIPKLIAQVRKTIAQELSPAKLIQDVVLPIGVNKTVGGLSGADPKTLARVAGILKGIDLFLPGDKLKAIANELLEFAADTEAFGAPDLPTASEILKRKGRKVVGGVAATPEGTKLLSGIGRGANAADRRKAEGRALSDKRNRALALNKTLAELRATRSTGEDFLFGRLGDFFGTEDREEILDRLRGQVEIGNEPNIRSAANTFLQSQAGILGDAPDTFTKLERESAGRLRKANRQATDPASLLSGGQRITLQEAIQRGEIKVTVENRLEMSEELRALLEVIPAPVESEATTSET